MASMSGVAVFVCLWAVLLHSGGGFKLGSSDSLEAAPAALVVQPLVHIPVGHPQTQVTAVLTVVTPTSPPGKVVCLGVSGGCSGIQTPIRRFPDPVLVPSSEDDVDYKSQEDKKKKVFFVDEDDQSSLKKKVIFVDQDDQDFFKNKNKKVEDVPVLVSYKGWQGTTLDDRPIPPTTYQPWSTRSYNFKPTSPYPYPYPVRKIRTGDIPVTFRDVPLGTETLLVLSRIVESSPFAKTLYSPYLKPAYPHAHSPGLYAGVARPNVYPAPQIPGFYGGIQPRPYPSPPPVCPTPGWSPIYPQTTTTTTTTPRNPVVISDRLDFDALEDEDKKKDDGDAGGKDGFVEVVPKTDLDQLEA